MQKNELTAIKKDLISLYQKLKIRKKEDVKIYI